MNNQSPFSTKKYQGIDPAFPHTHIQGSMTYKGMTLRDYFAAKAMQFLLGYEESNLENDAKHAYAMADAMLKAREA